MLTVKQVAKLMGVHEHTVERAVANHELPCVRQPVRACRGVHVMLFERWMIRRWVPRKPGRPKGTIPVRLTISHDLAVALKVDSQTIRSLAFNPAAVVAMRRRRPAPVEPVPSLVLEPED